MLFADGTVALVTGGSRGIGSAVARDLAREGATVVVNYNSGEGAAKRTVEMIESAGGAAFAWQADTTDEAAVIEMFDEIKRRYGKLDILVANAGIIADSMVATMTVDQMERVLSINVTGMFLCCREAVKMMVPGGGGAIVTMSSVTTSGAPAVANYSASKAAVAAFTKSLASEVALSRVRVNTVSPGFIDTKMTKTMHPVAKQHYMSTIAMQRAGTPDEVAYLVSFLASDKAAYITGADFAIDGGASIGLTLPTPESLSGGGNGGARRRMSGSRVRSPQAAPEAAAPAQTG